MSEVSEQFPPTQTWTPRDGISRDHLRGFFFIDEGCSAVVWNSPSRFEHRESKRSPREKYQNATKRLFDACDNISAYVTNSIDRHVGTVLHLEGSIEKLETTSAKGKK